MARPTLRPQNTQRIKLAIVRILIASFFVAIGVGLVPYPSIHALTDTILPPGLSQLAATTFIFVASFAIMVGKSVRGASLLLALFLFWSSFIAEMTTLSASLEEFWLNSVLIGVLLLVAITEPGGSARLQLRNKIVRPRRVRPAMSKLPEGREMPMFSSVRAAVEPPKPPTLRLVHQAEPRVGKKVTSLTDCLDEFPNKQSGKL